MQADSNRQESPVPGLDPIAARPLARAGPGCQPWLHEEVGSRMAERLRWIKQQPTQWLDWSPLNGGLQAHRQVAELYPQAKALLAGPGSEAAQGTCAGRRRGLESAQVAGAGPVLHDGSTQAAGLLWANMALHQEPLPRAAGPLAGSAGGRRLPDVLLPGARQPARAARRICPHGLAGAGA